MFNQPEPDYQGALSGLYSLSHERLKELFSDDDKLDSMIKDLPQVKTLEAEREMLLASNKSLAEYNLSKEPTLASMKHQLVQLYQTANELSEQVREKKHTLDQLADAFSLEKTLNILRAKVQESDEASEEIAEKFLDGKLPLDQFLEEFQTARQDVHMRRVKADKMAEMLTSSSSGASYPVQAGVMPLP